MAPRKRKNQAAAPDPVPAPAAASTNTANTRSTRRNSRNAVPEAMKLEIAAPVKRTRGRPRKNPIVIPVDPLDDSASSLQSDNRKFKTCSGDVICTLIEIPENDGEIVNFDDNFDSDCVVECVTEEIVADDDNNDTNDSLPEEADKMDVNVDEVTINEEKIRNDEENIENIQEFMKEQDTLQSTVKNESIIDSNIVENITEEVEDKNEEENVNFVSSDSNLDNSNSNLDQSDNILFNSDSNLTNSDTNVYNKLENIVNLDSNVEIDPIVENTEINSNKSTLDSQTDIEMTESTIELENNQIQVNSDVNFEPEIEKNEPNSNFDSESSKSTSIIDNNTDTDMPIENNDKSPQIQDENTDNLNERIENLDINQTNENLHLQPEIDEKSPIEVQVESKFDEIIIETSNCESMDVVESNLDDSNDFKSQNEDEIVEKVEEIIEPEETADKPLESHIMSEEIIDNSTEPLKPAFEPLEAINKPVEAMEKTLEIKESDAKSKAFEDEFTKALKNLDTSLEDTKAKKSKKKPTIREIKLKPKETKPKDKAKPSKSKKEPKIRMITLKTKAERKEYKPSKKLEKSEEELSEESAIRRSNRIKSIKKVQKRSTGHGLVRSKSESVLDSSSLDAAEEKSVQDAEKATKSFLKSAKSCDAIVQSAEADLNKETPSPEMEADLKAKLLEEKKEIERRLKQFVHLKDNLYLTDRQTCKEAKKMVCDCFLTEEEIERKELGCGDDCLNRLLMIECGNYCPVGDRCTNKRFQKIQFAPVEVFKTEKKGLGLRAAANIPYGEFILEYVGEVLDPEEFEKRADIYSNDKNIHYYFMSLRSDAIIDATMKGNISRFINHSCDPNAETQKWTVNGELRIGFFSTRTILAGEEITFDYRFQRYGKEAQKCYCGSSLCRGWLGEEPESDEEEEEGEEDEEEAEDIETDKSKLKDNEKLTEKVKKPAVKVKTPKKRGERKKPTRKEKMFNEVDQLDEEIDILNVTGLKNQAHTLKLCRLMVLAKEPAHRLKLVNILRRGELPCRRLFLDYHGLRLMHGYMVDAANDDKCANLRLEILETLASLPIPNKTMLQDSKVLPTVESWSINNDLNVSPLDSESSSPKNTVSSTSEEMGIKNENESPKIENESPKVENESPKVENVSPKDENESSKIENVSPEVENVSPKIDDVTPKENSESSSNSQTEININNDNLMQIDSLENSSTLPEDNNLTKNNELMEVDNNQINDNKDSTEIDPSQKMDEDAIKIEPPDNLQQQNENIIEKPNSEDAIKSEQDLSPKVEVSSTSTIAIDDKKEEIIALCLKLLEDWKNLKEVFRIPKKERIEQMKEHEREANRKYMASGYNAEVEMIEKKFDRYRLGLGKCKSNQDDRGRDKHHRKGSSYNYEHDRNNPFNKMSKHERRKIFALQFELKEEERRMKQREMWRQHERNCMMLGTDPRLTAPFDPNRGFQCIWNPQLGQWQNVPFPSDAGGLPPPPGHKFTPPSPYMILPPPMALQQAPHPHHHPPIHYVAPYKILEDDPNQVKFMGPIPPPVKLPPKWKCAKDKYGRPYYYHVKIRVSQWEPPPFTIPPVTVKHVTEELSETESSSDTSSLSSSSSSENSDSDDDVDDTKLLLEVRRRMEKSPKATNINKLKDKKTKENVEADLDNISLPENVPGPAPVEMQEEAVQEDNAEPNKVTEGEEKPPPSKKRRVGLCTEIIISPRTEEDRLQFREDLKRYKENKEMLKREKELLLRQKKRASTSTTEGEEKKPKEKRSKNNFKSQIKEMTDGNSEAARRIKETFRSNMATVVVGVLNYYRKPDCKEGRITNTEDFKHLARKLTHFVMLKEIKHISKIEDLTCTDNVKSKARDYIKKYMSKFGECYQKRNDEPDFKD